MMTPNWKVSQKYLDLQGRIIVDYNHYMYSNPRPP